MICSESRIFTPIPTSRWRLGAVALLLALALPAGAEEEAPIFGEAVEVRVVDVDAVVTDRRGRPITGLGPEDFELRLDGEPVAIEYFYAAGAEEEGAELPKGERLHLAIYFDHRHLTARQRERLSPMLLAFLRESLRPEDRVMVVSAEDRLDVLLKPTATASEAAARLEALAGDEELGRPAPSQARFFLIARELEEVLRWRQAMGRVPPSGQSQAIFERIRGFSKENLGELRATAEQLHRLVAALGGIEGRKAILYVSDRLPMNAPQVLLETWQSAFGRGFDDAQTQPLGAGGGGEEEGEDPFAAIRPGQTLGEEGPGTLLQGIRFGELELDARAEMRAVAAHANAARVSFYTLDSRDPASGRSFDFSRGGANLGVMDASSSGEGFARGGRDVPRGRLEDSLEFLASATGGLAWVAEGDFASHLERLRGDFEHYYSLGFVPPTDAGAEPEHLEVKVRRRGLKVRHRELYRPRSADEEAASAALAAALLGVVRDPLGLEWRPLGDEGATLPMMLRAKAERLVLVPEEDLHRGRLSIFVTVADSEGGVGPVEKAVAEVEVPSAVLETGEERWVEIELPLPRPPEGGQVALAVRDDLGSELATFLLDEDDLRAPEPTAATTPTTPLMLDERVLEKAERARKRQRRRLESEDRLAPEGAIERADREIARDFSRSYAEISRAAVEGLDTAAARLAALEIETLARLGRDDPKVYARLGAIERRAAAELAGEIPELLLPAVIVHGEAARKHRAGQRFALAELGADLARRLAVAHALGPEDARAEAALALADLGASLQITGMTAVARTLFAEALELDPAQKTALLALAVDRERHGLYTEALGLLERLLEIDPEHREARLRSGLQLLRTGGERAGRRRLRSLLAEAREDWVMELAYQELASSHLENGRPGAASALLGRAVARLGQRPGLVLQLTWARQRSSGGGAESEALAILDTPAPAGRTSPRRRYTEGPAEAEGREALERAVADRLARAAEILGGEAGSP